MKKSEDSIIIPKLAFLPFIALILITIIFNIIYTYSTKFKKTIIVDEKFTYGSNNAKGSQSISDTNNNIYILKDSLYVLHFTSVELFNKLDPGNTYQIEGYGVRWPFMGWFPNITKAKKINNI